MRPRHRASLSPSFLRHRVSREAARPLDALRIAGRAALVLAALAAAGCGSDSDPVEMPRGHGHVEIGSSAVGGGTLALEIPFDGTIEVFESAEIGNVTLWSGTNPGIATVEPEDEKEGHYALPDGVPLSLEITALDAGVRFKWGETTIEEPGESVLLGTSPFHSSGEWQVVLPQGLQEGEYDLSFRITTTTPPFAASEVSTVTLIPTEGGHGHDEGGHGG